MVEEIIEVSGMQFSAQLGEVPLHGTTGPPKTVKEIRSFLGHARFYRRFIEDFSKISRPLCQLLGKDVEFKFNKECLAAFNKLKELLTSTLIM
ncbi:unnamed protein product [Prunus armeniaca]